MNVTYQEIEKRAAELVEKSHTKLTKRRRSPRSWRRISTLQEARDRGARAQEAGAVWRVAKHVTPSRESVTPACHASRRDVPILKQAEELDLSHDRRSVMNGHGAHPLMRTTLRSTARRSCARY